MGLQIRFGIAGAALGLVIGILGCLIAGAPFVVILWKTLLAILFGGILGFALHAAIKSLLPELLQESAAASRDELGEGEGHSVNITLPEEGPAVDYGDGADQAAPLRHAVRQAAQDDGGELAGGGADEVDGDMIEEVSEDRRSRTLGSEMGGDVSFNEAAFYDGVEHLPDIGGFSEQFQAGDGEVSAMGGSAGDDAPIPGGASGTSKGRNKNGPANLDPKLVAQAISTALKKDDR